MADKTINGLTATTSAATADEIPIWVAGSAVTRKITKANFLQGAFTGGGTVATGGFTLTVPATGTAALLGTAQTFSALKTFSAGISFGDETLSTYDEGTWTPDLSFGGVTTGIAYSGRSGYYVRIGSIVLVQGVILLSSKGSAGSGNAAIGNLPTTSHASAFAWLTLAWQNMTSSYVNMTGFVSTGTTSISVRGITAASTTNITNVTFADFANNTILYFHGVYRAA